MHLQSKLLRVLQEKSFEPVGSDKPKQVQARVIVASNRDLQSAVEKDEFREDLFHRLNLVALCIPPLRKRPSDIRLLAEVFLRQSQGELNKTVHSIEPGAIARLQAYSWPGNVRELEHCIKRAVLLAGGSTLSEHDLEFPEPGNLPDLTPPVDIAQGLANATREAFRESLEDDFSPPDLFHTLINIVEQTLVREALASNGNNQVAAARVLGLHRTTLRKKMEEAVRD